MSIQSYYGQTFVGFIDISGFKELMRHREKARNTLDKFYRTIYNAIADMNFSEHPEPAIKINSVVVSDCAILFLSGWHDDSNGNFENIEKKPGLEKLLSFVQKINQEFIREPVPFMTTCSVAYGDFEYRNKYERDYIRKNCIMGKAYIDAFLDNESSKPKIQPGQCRIIMENLNNISIDNGILSLVDLDGRYGYFYWMLNNRNEFKSFKEDYEDTYQLKYKGMISVLQRYAR